MIRSLVILFFLTAILDSTVNSSPVLNSLQNENETKPEETIDVTYETENNDELDSLVRFLEENPQFLLAFLRRQKETHSNDDAPNHEEAQEVNTDEQLSRNRRRLSVFKNIYHQCRIQKRKEKDYCLQIANLYQNVKGYHGI